MPTPSTGELGTAASQPGLIVPMFGAGGHKYAQSLSGQLTWSGALTNAIAHIFTQISVTLYRAVGRAIQSWSTYSTEVLGDHPIGYWRLADNQTTSIFDYSGFLNLGTGHGTITASQTGALNDSSNSMLFDGSTGYISIASTAFDPSGVKPFSIEALVKPTTIDTNIRRIVGREPVTNHGTFLYWQSSTGWGFLRGDSSAGNDIATGGTSSTSAFSHIAGTYDGINMRLYVNGVLIATTASSRLVDVQSSALEIGGTVASLNGAATIQEIAVYSYALTAQQVTNHHSAFTTIPPAGLFTVMRTLE